MSSDFSASSPPGVHRKDRTRQRILDAALDVFSAKGYHDAVVDDTVRASQTSKGAFYFHFPSKQDVFLIMVDELASALALGVDEAIGGEHGAVAKVDAALRAVLDSLRRHQRLAKILLVSLVGLGRSFDVKLLDVHAKFAGLIKNHLDQAVAEGAIAPIDTEVAAYAWLGAIYEVVTRWLYTGKPESLDRTLPGLRALLLRSIGVDPNGRPAAERGDSNLC